MGRKLILGFVVIIVVAGLVLSLTGGSRKAQSPTSPTDQENGAAGTLLAPTGNVDDAVAAILNDASLDQVPSEELDPSLFADDTTALEGFSQSLDGAQF